MENFKIEFHQQLKQIVELIELEILKSNIIKQLKGYGNISMLALGKDIARKIDRTP